MNFVTNYSDIVKKIYTINPITYGKTRNHLGGAVTRISPYITHGVISLPFIRDIVLEKYSKREAYTFIFELTWREFFQRTFTKEGATIFSPVKHEQEGKKYEKGLPKKYLDKRTGLNVLDDALEDLDMYGYIHNHARMWLAMYVTNIAKVDFREGARHMYYHLLDGDLASNTLSWQWVCGTFSSKQYVANQEMIDKYSTQKQSKTFLDIPVTSICMHDFGAHIGEIAPLELISEDTLFINSSITLDEVQSSEVWLYSIWTLDPTWKPSQNSFAQKILFIDKENLKDFPMSSKRVSFIFELSKNIAEIKIYYGTKEELFTKIRENPIYRKDHPALIGWVGRVTDVELLFPQVQNIPQGFMSFWKKCEPYLLG